MKSAFFFSAIIFLVSCTATDDSKETIEIVGRAKMKVVPDMVELSLQSYNVSPAMKDAVAKTQGDINAILGVCRKYVVHPSDIKVSSVSTNKAYDYQNNKSNFIGYDAMQVLDVTLKDISKIEQFTEELLATKISKITNIRYNHTKADSLLREVNLMALEDARKTAEKMCNKMNTTLGKITHLANYNYNATNNRSGIHYSGSDYDMNLYNKSFGGQSFKMSAEILEIEDVAYASFALK
jgi:uncharacterized protein YggE